MKGNFFKTLLTFGLAVSMVTGSMYAAGGSQTVYAEETAGRAADRVWDLTAAQCPAIQGTTGVYEGIQIDATNGKFSPRSEDTQVNANTILSIPVEANSDGAVLTIRLSGGSATVEVNGQNYESANGAVTVPVEASEEDTQCTVVFTAQAYLASIELSYSEPAEEYPGVPGEAEAADVTYTFESADGLLDAEGNAAAGNKLEGNRGIFRDLKVDAQAGKFNIQPEQTRTVINAGTVLYIPAAYDAAGAELLIAGTQDGSTPSEIRVNGASYTTNTEISLDMSDASAYPQYVKVEFDTIAYVTLISVNYASDSDYPDPEVEAKDKVWDFTASSAVTRPELQGTQGEYDGIQIDATTGKFSPRETDTQVNAGTTLYIPAAPDENGASLTVAGNNYNDLTVTLDGKEISVGEETALPAVEKNTYVALEFSSEDGTGSCYLYNISIDYRSDSEVNVHTVTVGAGAGYDYSGIQEALDANESSASDPLVIQIAPGTYTEKIQVDKPWVSFQPLYANGKEIVIENSYYSSNTFDADGNFIPQDEYDVGTDKCGTVLLTANATGFSAVGITFQNSYNVTDHTGRGEQTPAVAFGSAADRVYLKDCRFIGRQDTLYLHGAGSRVQVENCYIEGTVDFVFGDADAFFTGCELHMAGFEGRDTGYYTAANTKKGDTGLVFYQCTLTADASYDEDSTVSLGRPWQTECYTESERTEEGTFVTVYDPERKNPTYESTSSSTVFVECTMAPVIQDTRWNVWTRKDTEGHTLDVTFHDDVRYAEYNSRGEDGNYLNPQDYPDIVLGTMDLADDAQGLIDSILSGMGFGTGIGNWTPSVPDVEPGTEQPENPGQEPGTGGQESPDGSQTGTDDPADSGHSAGSGQENEAGNGTVTDAAVSGHAVQTGDTSNVLPYAVGVIAAAAVIAVVLILIRSRRK